MYARARRRTKAPSDSSIFIVIIMKTRAGARQKAAVGLWPLKAQRTCNLIMIFNFGARPAESLRDMNVLMTQ